MIKVFDGKRYDTDNADAVFAYSNGAYQGDFKLRTKTLYRTKKGAWFIHHVGGPLTDMAVSVAGGGRGWGEKIEPVDDDDAYHFLEAHSDDSEALEVIEQHFPERVEDA
tara:strand:+ start:194 stop:520 length:327 start_codon:yes stop_codon:yes gene_type:complete